MKNQFSIGPKRYDITYSGYHSCLKTIVLEDEKNDIEIQIPFEVIRDLYFEFNDYDDEREE